MILRMDKNLFRMCFEKKNGHKMWTASSILECIYVSHLETRARLMIIEADFQKMIPNQVRHDFHPPDIITK